MNDLISRQDAIDAVKEYFMFSPREGRECAKAIERVPPAHPRAGKWIYGEHESAMCDGYRCNKCGFFVPWDYQHKFIDFIKDYNYCPSCGADMRGENE